MNKKLPVYDLHDFDKDAEKQEFYANYLGPHVRQHAFTNLPHKHDFYLVMLVTKGSGWHEIDFVKYPVKAGSVFLMQPGQMHYWKLQPGIDGYVFFHSRAFYDEDYATSRLKEFPFFKSFQGEPAIILSKKQVEKLGGWMKEMIGGYASPGSFTRQKLHALVSLVYIELAENYSGRNKAGKQTYLAQLYEFEKLLEKNFREVKSAGEYAKKLHITEKHLNRITRECLDKTSTQLIAERVLLEAKRMLIHSGLNVTQTGYELGFMDKSYFVRFFKKHAGETPASFLKRYHQRA